VVSAVAGVVTEADADSWEELPAASIACTWYV